MKKILHTTLMLTLTFSIFLGLGLLALNVTEVDEPIMKTGVVTAHAETLKVTTSVVTTSEIPQQELVGDFKLTFYDDDVACCGNTDGITKSGAHVQEGVTIAVDPSVIPLGTEVCIEGIGYRTAQDTGGAIDDKRIDVYVSTHSKALELGIKYAKVYIVEGGKH